MLLLLTLHSLTLSSNSTSSPIAIGIDLGTTFSVVGIFENNRVEIIPNSKGTRLTPSVVSFHDGGLSHTVGDSAKASIVLHPRTTVYSIKRLIGLRYSDPDVQRELQRLPYEIVDKNDRPYIKIETSTNVTLYSPEEISAMILEYEKSLAEEYCGKPVKDAVITVPAYFNDGRRKATIDAGKIARLNVLQIINEPTAACIAYGYGKTDGSNRKILVFDFGGGTFDVSIVEVKNGSFEVKAVSGDSHLGGDDFDQRIVEFLSKEYLEQTNINVSEDDRVLAAFRKAATKAKIDLSQDNETVIQIDGLASGDFNISLTRARFEDFCSDLFERTSLPLMTVISDSKLKKSDLDDVVLVGGSTRMPRIRQIVRDFFDGREPAKNINPDEAVAWGAALRAAMLIGDPSLSSINVSDVIPLSLGLAVKGKQFFVMIPRNTRFPTQMSWNFTTVEDYQNLIQFVIYEGERPLAKDNHVLGNFTLEGIQLAPRQIPVVNVTFEIDENGVLDVDALDLSSGAEEGLSIEWNQVRLSPEERYEAILKAEQMREHDEKIRESLMVADQFEEYLRDSLSKVMNALGNYTREEQMKMKEIVDKGIKWINKHVESPMLLILAKRKKYEKLVEEVLHRDFGGWRNGEL